VVFFSLFVLYFVCVCVCVFWGQLKSIVYMYLRKVPKI